MQWSLGTCWAGGQTKLPLLQLPWAYPPHPTCPSSHLLPPPQAAPASQQPLPSLAWEEAQRGGLSQRRKPVGPWGPFRGWEGSLNSADQEGCLADRKLVCWGGGAEAGSSRLRLGCIEMEEKSEWAGDLTCEPAAEALACGALESPGTGSVVPALRVWPRQSGHPAECL